MNISLIPKNVGITEYLLLMMYTLETFRINVIILKYVNNVVVVMHAASVALVIIRLLGFVCSVQVRCWSHWI